MIKIYLEPEYHGENHGILKCCLCSGFYQASDPLVFLMHDIDGKTEPINASFGHLCKPCILLDDETTRKYLRLQAKELTQQADQLRNRVNSIRNVTYGCSDCSMAAEEEVRGIEKWGIPSWEETAEALETCADFELYERTAFLASSLLGKNLEINFTGYVYLLGSPEGYCKIGRTKELNARMYAIGLQLPFRVEVLHTIEVSDPVKAERFLHKKFKECRANGEWFLLDKEQINWVKSQTNLEGLY